jgi:hypothetical protein
MKLSRAPGGKKTRAPGRGRQCQSTDLVELYTQNFSRLICIDAGEAAGAGKGGIFLAFFNKKYFKIKASIFFW